MMVKIVHLVIGLPGSGKTYYMNKNANENDCIIDDISSLDDLRDYFNEEDFDDCWISDVNFCNSETLKKAKQYIEERFKHYRLALGYKYKIEVHCFEKNVEVCKANIKHRMKNGDKRDVWKTLKRFENTYNPPSHAMKVFDTRTLQNKTIWDDV